MKVLVRAMALALCFALAFAGSIPAEEIPSTDGDAWVTFLLICNEGMLNDGGDVGNTIMVVSMNPELGSIRQLMVGWDTFIEYPGFETPQLLDKPFRVGGPEEMLKLFNEN
ncbi:MAG TPA: hypothetical protein PKE04_08465, partial [Clostridia bacterium]|nr:hypothetical protein [Clostridia bacterium]